MSEEATLDDFGGEVESEDVVDEHPRFGSLPDEWRIREISEVAEVVGGSTPSTSNEDYWGGGIPWATPTDITGLSGNTISETEDTLTEEGLKSASTHLLPPKSVLMTSRATIGKCAVNTVEMATNQGFKSLVPGEEVEPWYLHYRMLDTAAFLDSLGSGSTFDEVSKTVVQSVDIPIPPLDEQRKIATVLYTVDQAIQKTEEIIEQAERTKRALLQALFLEGYYDHDETVEVHHRNRLHKHPADWETEPAKDVMDVTRGAHPRPKSDKSLWGGNIPMIKIGDRNRGDSRTITSTKDTVTEKGSQSSKLVDEGTLIVSNAGTVGAARITGMQSCIHDHWLILRNYGERLNTRYLYYFINWNQDFLESLASGSTVLDLNTDDFRLFDITIPSLEEQKEIADTLDSVHDKKIVNQRYRKHLQRLKQGIMQDLLSGTVRTTNTNIAVPEEITQHG